MARVIITQTRSRIGSTKNQRANLDALGLRKINQTVQHDDSAIILGMLNKVKHMVSFEIVESEKPAKKTAPKAKEEVEVVAGEAKAEKSTAPKASAKTDEGEKAAKPAAKKAAPKKEAAPKEEVKAEVPVEKTEE